MSFRVVIKDTGLKVKLALLPTLLPEIIDNSLIDIGLELEAEMAIEAPVKEGFLQANMISAVDKNVMRAGVDRIVPYGRRVALGFVGPDSLGRVFKQRPNEFHLRALESVRPNIPNIVRASIEKATEGL